MNSSLASVISILYIIKKKLVKRDQVLAVNYFSIEKYERVVTNWPPAGREIPSGQWREWNIISSGDFNDWIWLPGRPDLQQLQQLELSWMRAIRKFCSFAKEINKCEYSCVADYFPSRITLGQDEIVHQQSCAAAASKNAPGAASDYQP